MFARHLERVAPLLMLVMLGAARAATLPATNCQQLEEQIKLQSNINQHSRSGEGGVALVPAVSLSLDLLSLIRLAALNQQEIQSVDQTRTISARQARVTSLPPKHYPRSKLNTVKLGGKDYFFSRHQKLSWIDAASFCQLIGMELVSVETREEDELILAHLKTIGLDGQVVVYTSGNKIGSSTYLWMNGEPLIYDHWRPGQPAAPASEHCLVYWDKDWHDYHCEGHPSHFICEQHDT